MALPGTSVPSGLPDKLPVPTKPARRTAADRFGNFVVKHRKPIILVALSVAICGVMIYLSYNFIITGSTNFAESFFGVKGKRLWLIGIFALMAVRSLVYALGAWVFLRRNEFDRKVPWWKFVPLALQMTFIQVVTPFTLGSQPWAIFYLKRKGYRMREVIPAIMARDTYHQACLVLVPLTLSPKAIVDDFATLGVSEIFATLLAVGMLIDFIGGAIFFAIGVSGTFQRFCLRVVHFLRIKILHQPRLESRFQAWLEKQQTFHANYVNNLKDPYASSVVAAMMLINIICAGILFYMAGQYVSQRDLDFYQTVGSSAAAYSASGAVPLPGGLGEQEYLLKIGTGLSFYSGESANALSGADSAFQDATIAGWRFWASFIPGGVGLLSLLIAVPLLVFKNKKWIRVSTPLAEGSDRG